VANILLVTADTSHTSVTNTTNALISLGHSVTTLVEGSFTAASASSYDLVAVTRANDGSSMTTAMEGCDRPLLIGLTAGNVEGTGYATLASTMGLGTSGTVESEAYQINVTDVSHPITAPVWGTSGTGVKQVVVSNNFMEGTVSPVGTTLALGVNGTVSTVPVLVAVERWTTRGARAALPVRIVYYGEVYAGQSLYTSEGVALLGTIVDWLLAERSVQVSLSAAWNVEQEIIDVPVYFKLDVEYIDLPVFFTSENVISGITTGVSQSMDSEWNVEEPEDVTPVDSDPMVAEWNVVGTVVDDIDAEWNVAEIVSEVTDFEWNVEEVPAPGEVSSSLDSEWNVAEIVSDSVDADWNVTGIISGNLGSQWTVMQIISDSEEFDWAVAVLVSDSVDAEWNLSQVVSDSQDVEWDVMGTLSDSLLTRWHVKKIVSDQVASGWAVLEQVTDTEDFEWTVNTIVTDEQEFSWDVELLPAPYVHCPHVNILNGLAIADIQLSCADVE
jgi:hypothetical protein